MLAIDSPPIATPYLDMLNPAKRRAVTHGVGSDRAAPLLVIAGAGSGKTNMLAHRVAHLIVTGADPRRILLMTFSRRAAAEMTRRVKRIARKVMGEGASVMTNALKWAGCATVPTRSGSTTPSRSMTARTCDTSWGSRRRRPAQVGPLGPPAPRRQNHADQSKKLSQSTRRSARSADPPPAGGLAGGRTMSRRRKTMSMANRTMKMAVAKSAPARRGVSGIYHIRSACKMGEIR
jgi:hypothetical protein